MIKKHTKISHKSYTMGETTLQYQSKAKKRWVGQVLSQRSLYNCAINHIATKSRHLLQHNSTCFSQVKINENKTNLMRKLFESFIGEN